MTLLALGGLELMGLPGRLVLVGSTLYALLHFRSLMGTASTVGFALKVAAFSIFAIAVLGAGIVPGVSVTIQIAVGTVVSALRGFVETTVRVWEVVA